MMLRFCFHVYFVLSEVPWRDLFYCCSGRRGRRECPHCHGDLSRKARRALKNGPASGSKDLYAALPTHGEGDEEVGGVSKWHGKDAGRQSTDEETAMLV